VTDDVSGQEGRAKLGNEFLHHSAATMAATEAASKPKGVLFANSSKVQERDGRPVMR
jgi:hypothetical protein